VEFLSKLLIQQVVTPTPISTQLSECISTMATPLGFNTSSIYFVNGLANAGFIGVFTAPMIVIDEDFLPGGNASVNELVDEELLAVVAHELGHWWHGHGVIKVAGLMLRSAMVIGTAFALRNFDTLYAVFGYSPQLRLAGLWDGC